MVHLSGVLIVVGYTLVLNYFSVRTALLSITALLLVFLEIEYVRLEHRSKFIKKFVSLFDQVFRKRERDNVSSSVFLITACIICFASFDYWVAFLALFMTVFGDLSSALMGKSFGKTLLFRSKTYVGSLSGLAANVIVGVLILPEFLILVLPMAFVATFTEVITNKLDDNLTVPLFAGFAGQMLVYYFELELPPIDFTFLGLFA
ncbi:MAG: hypothetical protein WC269_04035 [Candidatus Gracilibacteria bacterium]|jgi:glycerol-3-phosphate acyltransferase PlsY